MTDDETYDEEPTQWETTTKQFKTVPVPTENGDFHLVPGSTYTAAFIAEQMNTEENPIDEDTIEDLLEETAYIRPLKVNPSSVIAEKQRAPVTPKEKQAPKKRKSSKKKAPAKKKSG